MKTFVAYFDPATKTTEVYPQNSAKRLAILRGTDSPQRARSALKSRGFLITGSGDYPYGETYTGKY